MNELTITEIEAAMRCTGEISGEKDHITRLEVLVFDLMALSKLNICQAGNLKSVHLHNCLDVSGAIEAPGSDTTPNVRGSQKRARRL